MSNITRWLDVEVGNDDIELNTLPSNLALVDLSNDNEYKLLIGDLGKGEESPKLKVFRGAMQLSDMSLPDLPLGTVGFYTSEVLPRTHPVIAVAFSSCIYIYRNMKLFYKYYLPSIDLSTSETEVWKQLMDPQNHNTEVISILAENLNALPHKILSSQSRDFLAMTLEQQFEYLEQLMVLPTRKLPEIACITTMKMHSVERFSVSCLVVGTEDGEVIILDPQTFSQLSIAKLCAVKRTPYQMVVSGLYSVDYRITVATREKCVCVLKRASPEGRQLFATDEHIIALEVLTADHSVMVICSDNTLACYSKKGKRQWCINLEHRPVAMTLVPVVHLGVTLTAVALASGHVYLYDGKARRDTMFVRDVVSVMRFGQLGQEEHVFVIVTGNGNLILKILKRTADFSGHSAGVDTGSSHGTGQMPWLIPKKSKLFLEQSIRERENAIVMHQTFQQELNRLRLLAANTLRDAHLKADNSIGAGAMEAIRLSAEVEGLGPVFRVSLMIENSSSDKAVMGLAVLFHADPANYKVAHPYIKVPLLPPNGKIKFPTKIEEVFDDISPEIVFRTVTGEGGARALVKVLLLKEGRSTPALAATVAMPPTDPMMLPYDKMQHDFDDGQVRSG